MTDLSPRPTGAASSAPVTELLALCAADYKDGAAQRSDHHDDDAVHSFYEPAPVSDLTVAIHVGQQMLVAYGDATGYDVFAYAQAHGGVTEALRILLRALDADPTARPPADADKRDGGAR